MLENKFKTGLVKDLKKRFPGCMVIHLDPNEIQGIPDLLVLYRDRWAALEGKKTGKASHRPNQDYYVAKMNEMSYASFIYADGTYTPAGRKRYGVSQNTSRMERMASTMEMRVKDCVNTARTQVTGRQYVDGYLKKGTTFSRIQTSKDFENFAFYATYKKADSDKYMGLFGKKLMTQANYDAKQAEKQANASGSEADLAMAATLRDKANNMKVYQLKLETVKKLKVPSDENASDITAGLLKEKEFKQNLEASIVDSKEKMRRPTQQVLFKQAENALKKDPTTLTASEKVAIYKALNLSLTNHNAQEVAAQSRFYAELSKKGYNALLDYNDKDYSSYHAKRPMIVFDTDSVRLQSVTETNPKVVDKLYMRYNAERIAKEVGANTIGYVSKLGNKTVSECSAYMERKMSDYLS